MTTTLDQAPPAWSSRLIDEFNAADRRAAALSKTLTPSQLNWTPARGVWSVGQCLEHLCISNEVYLAPMSSSLVGHQQAAVQEITPGWFGRWFIRSYIDPSTMTARRHAPRKITPRSQVDAYILDRFLSSNEKARDLVRRAANCDVNRIRFRNPFIPVIRFTVGTGLEILSKHQNRHLLQADLIKASLDFPRVR